MPTDCFQFEIPGLGYKNNLEMTGKNTFLQYLKSNWIFENFVWFQAWTRAKKSGQKYAKSSLTENFFPFSTVPIRDSPLEIW